jgi:hypothetical protein
MKIIITAVILCAVAICAPAAEKKKEKTTAPAPQAVTIPKDAIPNADGVSYIYTDKQGKKWTFTKTPFGIMKAPYAEAQAGPPQDWSSTKAIDQGETVRFERPGPFGTMSWEKKKPELTDDERRVLDRQSANTEQK